MAEVKELILELALNNEKLIQGLKQTDTALNKTSKEAKGTASSFNNLKTSFASVAAGFAAAGLAAAATIKFLKDAIDSAAKEEKAQKSLAEALKRTGVTRQETFDDLLDYASALQKTTNFQDENIVAVETMLVRYGAQGKMLKELTAATLDFAAATKIDLDTAATMVAKSIEKGGNALGKWKIAVDQNADTGTRMQQVLDGLNSRFGGEAVTATQTFEGRVKKVNIVLGDLQETLGKNLIMAMGDSLKSFERFATDTKNIKAIENAIIGTVAAFRVLARVVQLNYELILSFGKSLIIPFQAALDIAKIIASDATVEKKMQSVKEISTKAATDIAGVWKGTVVNFGKDVQEIATSTYDAFANGQKSLVKLEATGQQKRVDLWDEGDEEIQKKQAEHVKKVAEEVAKYTTADQQTTDARIANIQRLLDAETLSAEQRLALEQSLNAAKIQMADEIAQKQIATVQSIISAAQELESGISETFSMFSQNRAQEYDNEMIRRTNALQAQLDQGLISEEQFADEKKKIDKDLALKKAKDERDLAGVMKALKITEIALSVASGIASAFSPYIPILSEIRAAIVTGVGIAQTAAVAAAPLPEIPTFAGGGVIDRVMPAPIRGEDGMIGVQRGESVLNRNATATLGADAIDAINSGRGTSNNVTINVSSNNGREVVEVLNDYFRQYGTSNRGQAT